ncbi:thermonuclease family protein [Mycoplasma tauri]|uniref:Thermonuclease family protein n=1 Tax=Mycoplasma tauri TaxID=547987 RepID=A0A953T6L0_9MOLU|nr:thermonuclease family protein [Mycoplasma tauri]MBZ4195286.1 thermonuclease family protein [Mycoplasma tauri]MBZ4218353.1 thermonuclease family protein [Mycoplasma tauri]
MKLKYIIASPILLLPIISNSCHSSSESEKITNNKNTLDTNKNTYYYPLSSETESYLNFKKIASNVYIPDGDTIYFYEHDERVGLRFFGIDTPETKKDNKKNQKLAKRENHFAQKAKNFLEQTLHNKTLYYEYIKRDRYNRKIGILYYETEDKVKVDVSKELLKNGLARVHYINIDRDDIFTVKEERQVKYFKEIKKIEKEAKNKKLNIWAYPKQEVFYR